MTVKEIIHFEGKVPRRSRSKTRPLPRLWQKKEVRKRIREIQKNPQKAAKGNRVGVFLPIKNYNKLMEELEEPDDIKAYDKAMSRKLEFVPLEQALNHARSGSSHRGGGSGTAGVCPVLGHGAVVPTPGSIDS